MNRSKMIIIIALSLVGALYFYVSNNKTADTGGKSSDNKESNMTAESIGFGQSLPVAIVDPVEMEPGKKPGSRNPNLVKGADLQETIQRPIIKTM